MGAWEGRREARKKAKEEEQDKGRRRHGGAARKSAFSVRSRLQAKNVVVYTDNQFANKQNFQDPANDVRASVLGIKYTTWILKVLYYGSG